MIKVLFICVHNSARSQIAEALLKKYGGDKFEVESAGLEPGKLNPLAVEVMKEISLDISNNKTKSVFDLYKTGKIFNFVITVCDKEAAERCPIFPGRVIRLHWSFDDPSSFQGTDAEKLEKTRAVRDGIENEIKKFLADNKELFEIW